MDASFYNGPQKTGEAIDANTFVVINAAPTPDTLITADNGTTYPTAMVATQALDSGQSLVGIQDGGIPLIKMVAGQNPAANVALTSTTDGEGIPATTGDHVYAVTTEPASASGGLVPARLVESPIVQP